MSSDLEENTVVFPVRSKILLAAFSLAGGVFYALALPPLNCWILIFFALIPLFYCGLICNWKSALLCGWLWGLGWAVFAYNFLREIHPAVPYMLAPVLALWPAVFTVSATFLARRFFRNGRPGFALQWDLPLKPLIRYLICCAALFTVVEWTRYYLFVWNDLSVTLWRVPLLMQIARLAGRYGASLLITSLNALFFALIFSRKRLIPAAVMAVYPLFCLIYGIYRLNCSEQPSEPVVWKCALIQGNLPQQRIASAEQIFNSINLYTSLSEKTLSDAPDTIIWPECAIPIPLRSNTQLAAFYRKQVVQLKKQLLLGTLDFTAGGELTNSALLISADGRFRGKYDKFHRVPYGEYVPFRSVLPESWIAAFDMGRDLAAGKKIEPLSVSRDIRVGTAVCYEGVFSYLSAGFARSGANVLAAISNDVWYPQSSEPEQHLANAVMRCVETGLPMVRCGNNGGSGVVTAKGVFTQYIGSSAARPELLREQAAGIVTVNLDRHPEITLAVRFENAIVYLLVIILAGLIISGGKTEKKEDKTAKNQ